MKNTARNLCTIFIPMAFLGVMGFQLFYFDSYHPLVLVFSALALIAAMGLAFSPAALEGRGTSFLFIAFALLLQCVFSLLLVSNEKLLYEVAGSSLQWLRILLKISFVLSLTQLALFLSSRARRVLLLTCAASMACMLLAHAFVIPASPSPFIDVFVNNTLASEYLRSGVNPYAQTYPDIYKNAYAYKPGFLYFPGTLLWQFPFHAVFGDIRYGFLLAQILIVFSILKISSALGKPPFTGPALAGLWIVFPVTLFVLEQSWVDSIVIALVFLSSWSLVRNNWLLTGALLGATFAVKQPAAICTLLGLAWIARNHGFRQAAQAALAAALTFMVVVAPFALPRWQEFYSMSMGSHLDAGLRLDAFNLTAYLARNYGWASSGFQLSMAVLGVLLGLAVIWKKSGPGQPLRYFSLPAALFIAYGFSFLLGKWAFTNYYYFLASLLLLALLLKAPCLPKETPSPANNR